MTAVGRFALRTLNTVCLWVVLVVMLSTGTAHTLLGLCVVLVALALFAAGEHEIDRRR